MKLSGEFQRSMKPSKEKEGVLFLSVLGKVNLP